MSGCTYTSAQKAELCARLSALPPSATKEIYNLIQDYARKSGTVQPKRLGGSVSAPFGAKKVGDDYIFEIDNLPSELLVTIERLLAIE